jgi:hypothetical protein
VDFVDVVDVNVLSDHLAEHLRRAAAAKFRNPDPIGLSGKEDHPDQVRSLSPLGRERVRRNSIAQLSGIAYNHAGIHSELVCDYIVYESRYGAGRQRGSRDHVAALQVRPDIAQARRLEGGAEPPHGNLVAGP